MSLLLVTSDRFADHVTPPGHPECAERARLMAAIARRWAGRRGVAAAEPRPATRDELARVHAATYLDVIASTKGRYATLDPDTHTSPQSYDAARLAAGAAILATGHAMAGRGPALALVRPPGHHAETERAMGFCLYNNVAVAAAHALASGLARVAIVDFDVHHGNGTQEIFDTTPGVVYASVHQHPFYPGTGGLHEIGRGAAIGHTVNVPLAAGATDADYDLVFDEILEPILRAFSPGILLVSAGYDAHRSDPLAGMDVSTEGFAAIAVRLKRLAEGTCDGRLVFVTEGGYDLTALEACLDATIEVLRAPEAPGLIAVEGTVDRAHAVLDPILTLHRRYWPEL